MVHKPWITAVFVTVPSHRRCALAVALHRCDSRLDHR